MMDRRHFSAALLAALASAPALARADGTTELQRQMADIEKASGGRLGVCILDTGSGLRAGHRADERFPMCSTFKFLAAAAVLSRVDQGKERLERRIVIGQRDLIPHAPVTGKHLGEPGLTMAELCEAAVTLSDNPAANLMLASFGGPAGLTRYLRSLGDTQTRLDRNEPGLNESLPGDPRDTTTPAAMLATCRRSSWATRSCLPRARRFSPGSTAARPATSACAPACPRTGRSATRPAPAAAAAPATSRSFGRRAARRSW